MNQTSLPSKQFLIRGGIATGIIALVLIVQTDWFRALFNKAPLPDTIQSQTVGEIVTKDSNGNGLADWEETLWGLDPTVLYTNGVPNKTVIEQRRLALGVSAEGSREPENETDALARELMTIATALGQSGQSNDMLAAVAAKMANSVEITIANNYYALKDVRTTTTTTASLRAYYNTFNAITAKYDKNLPEINLLIQGIENDDLSRTPELLKTRDQYVQYAKELIAMTVPVGIEHPHLEIVNSLYAMGLSLKYLAEVEANAVNSLAGIALYRLNDQRLTAAGDSVIEYMVRYGILTP